jgi:hypothetical protein
MKPITHLHNKKYIKPRLEFLNEELSIKISLSYSTAITTHTPKKV